MSEDQAATLQAIPSPPQKATDGPEFLREGAGIITVETAEGKFEFFYPKTVFMRNLVLHVLNGDAYPVLKLPGYSPEIILDVGSNVGSAAMYFHLHFPEASIHCYEPSGRNIPYLTNNVLHLKGVHVHPYGLFDCSLTTPLYGGNDNTGQDTIARSPEAGLEVERVRLEKASEEARRLGIQKISILKIDTEGCEIPILKELIQAVDRIDLLYVEYHSETDRLEMDRLLSGSHFLVLANAGQIHRGTNLYVSKELAWTLDLEQGEILPPFPGGTE